MKILVLFSILIVVLGQELERISSRIIGGISVDIAKNPYQASVRYGDQHVCGGAIISANTVVTAAHCVHDLEHSAYSVRIGDTMHEMGQSFAVANIIEHPFYKVENFDKDIAILKLSQNITFNSRIQPIALQPTGLKVSPGSKAQVSGWGVVKENSKIHSIHLRAASVTVISKAKCKLQYKEKEITSSMLCALSNEHDSCKGDSGGPLVASGKLIGIVSWGFGCGNTNFPGVYTKISKLHKWINQYMY